MVGSNPPEITILYNKGVYMKYSIVYGVDGEILDIQECFLRNWIFNLFKTTFQRKRKR